jgi:diguanylate cyclase (GGDEF)-like protein
MRHVEQNLKTMTFSGDLSGCTPENCAIPVDSRDEIGESAGAFNRLVESLSISMRTQAAVRSFSEMLTSQLEIETLADNALLQFFEHTGAAGGAIFYESDGELKIAASRALRDPEAIATSDHIIAALRTERSQVVSIPDDVRVEGVVADFRPSEVIVSPIGYRGVPLGVVVLASARPFNTDHRALITLFLQGLGLALNNALVHDRLQLLAALDPLTGIYNRRFGLARLHEEFSRAVRADSPLGVLMFDVDHFKAVNDTYGHLVGDRVLKSICAIARSTIREGDVLFRYGGEEFVAVLPAAAAEDLRILGERLRRAVMDSELTDGQRKVRVTVSIGGVAYPNHDIENDDGMIRVVDEALYRAKESGRNRTEIST